MPRRTAPDAGADLRFVASSDILVEGCVAGAGADPFAQCEDMPEGEAAVLIGNDLSRAKRPVVGPAKLGAGNALP